MAGGDDVVLSRMAEPSQREFHDEDSKEHRQDQRAENPRHHATQARIPLGFVVEVVGHLQDVIHKYQAGNQIGRSLTRGWAEA